MRNYKLGFTLTELLIAIAVIGILVVLVLPNVMNKYQNKSMLMTLQKTYVELGEALELMQTENYNKGLYKSRLSTAKGDINTTVKQFYYDYMQYKKDCKTDTQPCFADSYGNISNNTLENFDCSDGYTVTLRSGAVICIVPSNGTNPANVYVDVNGNEKPNIGGRDMFTFNIYDDYSIDIVPPEDIKNDTAKENREKLFDDNCKSSSTGVGCIGKLIENDWNLNLKY